MKKFLALFLSLVLLLGACSCSIAETEKKDFYLSEFKKHINENAPFDITEYTGQNLIISFWTTWCPYCVQEIPDFVKFKNEFKDNVRILMIHVPERETAEDAQKFFEKNNYGETLELLEDNGFYAQSFGVQGFPTNIVFNKEGKLVNYGFATNYDNLKAFFEKNNMFEKAEDK